MNLRQNLVQHLQSCLTQFVKKSAKSQLDNLELLPRADLYHPSLPMNELRIGIDQFITGVMQLSTNIVVARRASDDAYTIAKTAISRAEQATLLANQTSARLYLSE